MFKSTNAVRMYAVNRTNEEKEYPWVTHRWPQVWEPTARNLRHNRISQTSSYTWTMTWTPCDKYALHSRKLLCWYQKPRAEFWQLWHRVFSILSCYLLTQSECTRVRVVNASKCNNLDILNSACPGLTEPPNVLDFIFKIDDTLLTIIRRQPGCHLAPTFTSFDTRTLDPVNLEPETLYKEG
jgi:hypothetical protein